MYHPGTLVISPPIPTTGEQAQPNGAELTIAHQPTRLEHNTVYDGSYQGGNID